MSYENKKFTWDFNMLNYFYNSWVLKWLSAVQNWTGSQKKQGRANLGFGNGDFDAEPTAESANMVTSGGVHAAEAQLRQDMMTAINTYKPLIINGNVVNAADEEDLTENNRHLLSFKDRAYSPLNYQGMGKVILRKNIRPTATSYDFDGFVTNVETTPEPLSGTPDGIYFDTVKKIFIGEKNGVNYLRWTTSGTNPFVPIQQNVVYMYDGVPYRYDGNTLEVSDADVQTLKNLLTQDMFYKDYTEGGVTTRVPNTNTIFVIQYDFELGENITIPDNCVLEFDGGSISAGNGSNMNTINGQNTKIISNSTIFNNVIISGTWKCPLIYSNWISSVTNNKLQQLINLTNNSIYNKIIVTDDIEVVLHSEVSDIAGIAVDIENKNDIEIIIDSTITLASNGYPDYKMFFIQNCNNIYIHGSGNIIGDKDNHDYTTHQNDGYKTHEWGRGICVRQSNSVIIDGLNIEKLTGDGLTLGSITNQEPSKNIKVNNISIHDCRRQGITIAKINGIIISNFHIYNISGTNPQSGIDIEPDNGGSAENIMIIKIALLKKLFLIHIIIGTP